jgi:HK97 family phage major capsid protein
VIRDSGVQVIPARNGVFYYNKKSASSSGYWVGENTAITESEPTFSQVEGRLKKMGVLIPISNDLLRLGDGSQFRTIEQDAIAELTETENAAFLDGSGTAYTPLGLFRVNSGTASNGDTAGQIGDDFTEAIQRLATLKVPTDNLRFVLHTSKYYSALKQVDSNSNQTYYARELANSGTIWGVPVIQSSQAPTNQMLLYRVNDVAIGQGYGLTVDLSDQTNFGQDQTLLRALASVDIVAKRDQAFDTTTSVTWA